jgi:hypothetical protein
MKAIQLDAPGPPDALHVRDLPLPQPPDGWVRIRIESFGINRSELHLRHGLATNATFPRVPGIESSFGTVVWPLLVMVEVGMAGRTPASSAPARQRFALQNESRVRIDQDRFARLRVQSPPTMPDKPLAERVVA